MIVRPILTALILAAFATASAQAITVDGDASDWVAAGLRQSSRGWDPHDFTGDPPGLRTICTTVIDSTFYAFASVGEYHWPGFDSIGIFIDADWNANTTLRNANGAGFTGATRGTDISLQCSTPVDGSSHADLNFWGRDGDILRAVPGGVPGAACWCNGSSFECSIPLNAITGAIAGLSSNVVVGNTWKISFGAKDQATDWHVAVLSADFNFSGTVDEVDYGIVMDHYDTSHGANWQDGDFDGNGKVDVQDLADVLAWQGYSTIVTVPEPSSGMMLLWGGFVSLGVGFAGTIRVRGGRTVIQE